MGALFSQRLVRATWAGFAEWKRRHGCLLVGTSPQVTADYRDVPYRTPTVLWMGWERRGLSPAQQALCDVTARIPMAGRADSLNLAVATGVMLYEIHRRHWGCRDELIGPASAGRVPASGDAARPGRPWRAE